MHYFYIIHSQKTGRFYIGETTDLTKRLKNHNNGVFQKSYTKIAKDWTYILTFETKSRSDALFIESFVKRMKSKKFIQRIVEDQSILSDILKRK